MNSFYPILRIGFGAWLLACAMAHAEDMPGGLAVPVAVSSAVVASTAPARTPVEPYVCPLAKCVTVSRFGARARPASTDAKAVPERHEGIDLRVTPGQTVRAARSGKVIFAGFSKAYVSRMNKTDQQHLIIVRHADGQSTRYVHLNQLSVRPPQDVRAGDTLGTTSESDEWTEPVLHFEIRAVNGTPLNPEKFVGKR